MKNLSLIVLLFFSLSNPLWAQDSDTIDIDSDDEAALEEESLDSSIEALKKEVLSLNRDLFILEEDLLFPANTQFSIFLSMNAGSLFSLDSVQIKIDDKNISNHLYTERELAALKRGGVQRLYIGNLPSGEHEIIAIFTGVGPKGRDYRRGETLVIEKTTEPQFVEFVITDDASKEQPEFDVRVWE
ncbi:MAG: AraC family transcriptional regulator [Pseudomonadota bacterium]